MKIVATSNSPFQRRRRGALRDQTSGGWEAGHRAADESRIG